MPKFSPIGPLLACPGCTLGDPTFLWTCFVVGTIPIAHLLLRPHVQPIKPWGIPQMSIVRFASLLILVSGLVPLWRYCANGGSPERFPFYFAGIAGALAYFWWRGCWLLDQHRVTGSFKTLLFPGMLGLGLAALGTATAILFLGILPSLPYGPGMVIYHLWTTLIVVVPLHVLVKLGLKFTFSPKSGNEIGEGVADVPPITSGTRR